MLYLTYRHTTSATLFATIERLSDGFYWNPTSSDFENAPALADKKIALTEGTGENINSYTAAEDLGTESGQIRIRIHDDGDVNDAVIATWVTQIFEGTEVALAPLMDTAEFYAAIRWLTALTGKITGAQTGSESFFGLDDTTERLRFAPDASGNRTVTRDPV